MDCRQRLTHSDRTGWAWGVFRHLVAALGIMGLALCACSPLPDEQTPTAAPTAPPLVARPSAEPSATLPAVTARPITSPRPSATPQPTPCQLTVQPALAVTWSEFVLGCPIAPGAAAINTAYAPFEGGQMLWRGDTDLIYVLFNDGHWTSYPNEWREGDPEFSCGEEDPLITPVRGFGRVWCDQPDVRRALGAVTAAEIGDDASAVQEFVNGTILAAPFGDLFILEGEDGTWRLVDIE